MRVVGLLNDKGRNVHAVDAAIRLAEAAKIMRDHTIGSLVVLGEDGTMAGLLTERDIVAALASAETDAAALTAADVMRLNVPTCLLSDTLECVMTTMTDHRARHLPVVEDGRVVGVLSIGDVVKRRLQELVEETRLIQSYATWGR